MDKTIKSLSLICLFYFLFAISAKSQPYNYHWAYDYGSIDSDIGTSQAVDAAGNIYTTGIFSGTNVDFDPGPNSTYLSSAGGYDVYFAKYKNDGSLIWAKSFGGPNDDGYYFPSIIINYAGDILLYGVFNGNNIDFDPGSAFAPLSSLTGSDAYIAKYDSDGNYIMAFSIDAGATEVGIGIKADHSGNIYLTGYFIGTVDFDPGAGNTLLSSYNASTQAIFFAKYTSTGDLIWAKNINPNIYQYNTANAISLDNHDNLYIGGYFGGNNVDFDPGAGVANLSSNSSLYDFFFAKYDKDGNYLWAHHLGYTSMDNNLYGLTTDISGNLYIGGYFWGTIDFDPGPGVDNIVSNGLADAYFAKFDTDGNYIFCKNFGGNSYDAVIGIALDQQNNIYVTGGVSGPGAIDFDPGSSVHAIDNPAGNTSFDVCIAKYDNNGNYIWATVFGNNQWDQGKNIIADQYQNIYVTGEISDGGPIDLDPGTGQKLVTSFGGNDIFILKYSPCPITEIISSTPATAIDQGSSTQLYISASGSIQNYQWKFNNTILTNSENIRGTNSSTLFLDSVQVEQSGIYTCEIFDSCGTTNVAIVNISVNPVVKVFEIITPNGDNKNESLYIQSINYYPDNEVVVYNRWGNIVYSKNGYKNEEWNGSELPDGSYFYVVKVNQLGRTFKGGLFISK